MASEELQEYWLQSRLTEDRKMNDNSSRDLDGFLLLILKNQNSRKAGILEENDSPEVRLMSQSISEVRQMLDSQPDLAELVFSETRQFEELMMMYDCTIREVQTKLEVLDQEFSIRYNRNPIASIESRVKAPMSIYRKLKLASLPVNPETIRRDLNDVAGLRVICNFIDDIDTVAAMLSSQDDVEVIEVKDYIRHPKENGYRSYHMIVEVPVFFTTKKEYMRAEIQFRTIAMNFWASLEHQIRYKKDIETIPEIDQINLELRRAADVITRTDEEMMAIRDHIDLCLRKQEEQNGNPENTGS